MGITHKWEGTTLIVTSDSGTSSCDLKGDKGDTGVRGPQGRAGSGSGGSSGTDVDLSEYALKSELPENVSELTNDRGYLTNAELTNYAKISQIPTMLSQLTNDKGYLTSIPQMYVTDTELEEKGYLTQHQSLAGYAKTADIPTKVSQLTNDSKFLTSVPSEYVTETELNSKGYLTQHQSLAAYAKKTDIPLNVSELVNDKGYITSIPSEYVTDTELTAKGYITETETIKKINEKIAEQIHLKLEIVTTLPAIGEDNIIYLVPAENGEGIDYYNEYVFTYGSWEKLGNTKVDLSKYYTTDYIDYLHNSTMAIIPTRISDLPNDAGYVRKSELETGEATWDNIKGNIIDTLETNITWDGNIEGRETHPTYTTFYKVSDLVISAEDAVGLGYCDYNTSADYTNESLTIPQVGNSIFTTMDNGKFWFVLSGVMCVYDDSIGCSKGIYFYKGTWDDGLNQVHYINKFTLEKEQIKEEYLPENIGGVVEGGTVKSITFTTVTELYNWFIDNSNKVLKIVFYAGANGGNITIEFHNVVIRGDGGVFLEKTMATDYFEGVTLSYYGVNLDNEDEGVLLTLRRGDIKFNLDGTSLLTEYEDTQINDAILQYLGGNTTVIYAD